ncbi:hypothetical protein D7030_07590 [Flavobacteriaceae bacterium AU392]|nr:hypothetical protein D1817_00830 [Flavobacteriaceae bacterium]RKM84985.1 hypothetical protein D7030_07590 [Flavobacteriaceae bacterium AU392]
MGTQGDYKRSMHKHTVASYTVVSEGLVIAFSKNLKEIYNIVHNQYDLYTDYYQLYRNFKPNTLKKV